MLAIWRPAFLELPDEMGKEFDEKTYIDLNTNRTIVGRNHHDDQHRDLLLFVDELTNDPPTVKRN